MIGSLLLSSAVDGVVPPRHGNRSDRNAPQGVYPCGGKDTWCALSVETVAQWHALTALIGKEAWSTDARFETAARRSEAHDEIDHAIAAWTRQLSSAQAEERLRAAGISAARVRRIDEVVDHANGSAVFPSMPERRVGSMRTTRLPFFLSAVDLPEPRSAPSLGEHSAEVLRDWLHSSDVELEELKRREVLQ
jgi:crotonobetainyl-CoA:carnitine CoA-transferase CaiB-like acyl-CoA transferase